MAVLFRSLRSLADFAIVFMVVARAQSGATASGPQVQYSALSRSGDTISATRVPVITSAGKTVYQDIILQFDADADGNLTLTSGFPTVVASPALQVFTLKPGKYAGPSNISQGKMFITITGPGVLSGGTGLWIITLSEGASNYTYPDNATIYSGPIESNPQYARLKKAGITSTAWS